MLSVEERDGTPLEPETRSTLTGLELLGNVGVVELLEQDERPTFIIDVANPANYTPGGPLQIVFANASLRAHEVSLFPGIFCLGLSDNREPCTNGLGSRYWRP